MSVTRTVFIDTALSNYASLAAQYDPNTFNVVLLNNASSSASQIQNWMQSNNAIAANINIVSSVGGLNGSVTPRIAFVDPSVANFQTVIASMPGNITVVVLDPGKDGIQQIHDYLAANASNVASVDIISHGSPGEVVLGSTVLNAASLGSYSSQLADIGSHLTADGDLLLYGCDVASGATGQQFITALAAATGADVAASTDLTGSAAAGGNWTLEASTGPIETAALDIADYNGLLDAATAVSSVTLSSDTGVSSSDYITKTAAQTITGTFSASTNGNSVPTIWVSTDGTGASRTQATVTYTDNAGNGSYSANVTLIEGTGKSIQFWAGANGNNPITGSKTYTLDMTAPTTTVSSLAFSNDTGASSSDFITNTAAQTVSGVLSANTVQGEVVRVSIDNGATWQTASNVVGQKTFSLSGVTLQGNNTLKVQVEDAAGNAGQAISQSYVLDTKLTAPTVALTTDSGKAGDGLTNNAALTFNTADSDATRVITVDSKIVTGYDPTTLADGSHTVSVADTDVAGNTKSASVSFTLDTKLTAPTVALTTDSGKPGDGLTNNAALTFNTADSDATRAITIDGQVVNSYDPSSLADGSHTVSVTDTDGAGNTKSASVSFVLDTKLTAPTVALTTDSGKAGDGLTNNAGLTFNAPDSDATRVITVDGKVVNSYDASSMADGSHTVSVTDTDSAGNTRNASLSFTLDTKLTAPTVALTTDSGKPGDGLTNNAGLTFNTADGDATRVITIDGKVVSSYDASALADGSHTVSVTDTDGAGNNGTTSVSFILDTKLTAPTVALTFDSGKPGDGLTNNAGLTFNTADSDATRVITVDGKVVNGYDASSLADGSHTVSVTDTDGAGNTGTASVSFVLDTKLTAPTVSLTTDSGKPGDGLTNNAGLTFNAADSDATRVITVDGKVVNGYDASALTDGSHTVSVTDSDGAGNTGTASISFILDSKLTTPTVALTTDSGKPGDGLTNNAGLTFNAADSDATRVITVDGKVVNSYDASALADGSHTISVTDTDGAGNTGTASVSFTLDTKLTAPTVALTTDSGKPGDGLTNNAGLTFNAADSDATRVITVDGKVVNAYDASALADGSHTVSVTDTDGAGNTGTAAVSFTLDTKLTAPTVALTIDSGTAGDGLTNNAGLNFNTADSDATRVITVDGKVVNSYDASVLADGSHTVSVTDTDGAGNTGTASVSFTLDTKLTAPTVSLTTDSGKAGDGLTNNAGLTFNTADSDATRVITVDGKVVNSYDASALADGSHTVSVTDTDGAGNTGTASVSFTLDTKLTAPTVALTTDSAKPGDGLTNNAGLTFNTADSDATRVITVDGKVVNSYDTSALTDGSHTVSVTDTDGAGNTGTASVSFTLDTKLTAPTVSLTTDSGKPGDGLTNNAGLTFNTADSDATRVITVDGKVVNSYDASALADGSHTVSVTDTDGAGNTGTASVSFTLDTKLTAPTVSLTTDSGKAGDGLTNNAGLTFNTADSDATRVITVDGKVVNSYDASALADGSHTVSVTDTDGAGNTGTASVSFTLDTKLTAPTVALTTDSGKPGDGLTNNAGLTFNAADSDATRVITIDGKVVNSYDASTLADGSHTVSVTDTDGAGNTGTASISFTLDTKVTAPTVALTTDSGKPGDGLTNKASLTFNTADSDATRVITVDGKVVNSYDASALADGNHTVSVTDTDGAGNTGTAAVSFTLDTKLTAPTVSLTTDSGKPGDGLTNNAGLTFNATDSDATRVITVDGKVVNSYDASALADGSHTVSVTDTDGAGNTGTASVSFTLDTKLTAPTVALTTDSGKPGDGLTNDAGLTFNAADSDATRVITIDGKVVNSYDASTLADGSHTVSVTDTDGAGNTGTASVSFTLDTKLTAPTVSLTTDSGKPGDGLTNKAGLTFNTADSDTTRVITVDGKVVNSYDASALADGSHTVSVTDTDSAGNTGTASVSFILDTKLTAPTVALTTDSGKPGDGLTNKAGLTFNTADSDTTRVITVDGKVVNGYDASALADGSHTVSVTDTDGAGNTGTASFSFTLDTKLTAPTVALTTDSGKPGDGLTNNASITFNTADSDATRVITVDGKVVNSYDASALADGSHTVSVTDTDGAGNTGTASVSFTLDTKLTAPTVALTTDSGKPGDGLTNKASLTFNTADSDATRVITVDGKVVNSYDASALADGSHTVSVTDTDGAGNTGTASVSFTLDTKLSAPTVALTTDSGKPGDGLTNDAGLTFNMADSDATRVITLDGKLVSSYDPSTLADGSHTVAVTDTDAAGNSASASSTFVLDTKAPVFTSPATASVAENIGTNQLVYSALASDDHAIAFSLGGADAGKFDISSLGAVTLKDNPNYEDINLYHFSVVATDAAGNHTEQAVALGVTNVNEAPVASPSSVSTIENSPITFQFSDFTFDPDAGDKLTLSLASVTASLSWANTDPTAATTLVNPVTHTAVDVSSLKVQASISADGTSITLTPPAELNWMVTGQAVKATFNYTVTDLGGLSSSNAITLVMTGSTSDKGVNLVGGNGDDTLSGNPNNNAEDIIQGGNGNDTISGYGGTDVLYGGNGDDKLSGGSGIDYLYGDSGNDTLDGGADGDYLFGGKGNDILIGGTGADKFVFEPQSGNDRILDFNAAEGDKLYFANIFPTSMTVDAFIAKYVTDTGNDLLITLPGGSIVLVGVPNVSALAGAISFGMPA